MTSMAYENDRRQLTASRGGAPISSVEGEGLPRRKTFWADHRGEGREVASGCRAFDTEETGYRVNTLGTGRRLLEGLQGSRNGCLCIAPKQRAAIADLARDDRFGGVEPSLRGYETTCLRRRSTCLDERPFAIPRSHPPPEKKQTGISAWKQCRRAWVVTWTLPKTQS